MTLMLSSSCQDEPEASKSTERPIQGTVTVDGASLTWVREGRGPTLFILGSSVYYPKAFSSGLRQHFEMVFVDGRHFVSAYAPPEAVLDSVDLSTFADDVEAVRQALGYEQIIVLGHSIHGQIALEYADRYPSATSGVVLIGAVPYAFEEFADATDEVWERLATDERRQLLADRLQSLDSLLAAAPPSRSFAVGYHQRSPLYWADPSYDATGLLEGLENGPAFGRLTSALPSREEARARLGRIQSPILLVLGKLDFVVPYTAWEHLIEGLGQITYVLLDGDSHNPQTESPDRFDPVLIRWAGGT